MSFKVSMNFVVEVVVEANVVKLLFVVVFTEVVENVALPSLVVCKSACEVVRVLFKVFVVIVAWLSKVGLQCA